MATTVPDIPGKEAHRWSVLPVRPLRHHVEGMTQDPARRIRENGSRADSIAALTQFIFGLVVFVSLAGLSAHFARMLYILFRQAMLSQIAGPVP